MFFWDVIKNTFASLIRTRDRNKCERASTTKTVFNEDFKEQVKDINVFKLGRSFFFDQPESVGSAQLIQLIQISWTCKVGALHVFDQEVRIRPSDLSVLITLNDDRNLFLAFVLWWEMEVVCQIISFQHKCISKLLKMRFA